MARKLLKLSVDKFSKFRQRRDASSRIWAYRCTDHKVHSGRRSGKRFSYRNKFQGTGSALFATIGLGREDLQKHSASQLFVPVVGGLSHANSNNPTHGVHSYPMCRSRFLYGFGQHSPPLSGAGLRDDKQERSCLSFCSLLDVFSGTYGCTRGTTSDLAFDHSGCEAHSFFGSLDFIRTGRMFSGRVH